MTSPPVDQWAFVGFTYDGTTAIYYLNGVEVGSFAGGTGAIFGGESALGNIVGVSDSGRFFDGIIDDVGIFNVALPVNEINDIMSNGITGGTAVSPSGKLATTWSEIKK